MGQPIPADQGERRNGSIAYLWHGLVVRSKAHLYEARVCAQSRGKVKDLSAATEIIDPDSVFSSEPSAPVPSNLAETSGGSVAVVHPARDRRSKGVRGGPVLWVMGLLASKSAYSKVFTNQRPQLDYHMRVSDRDQKWSQKLEPAHAPGSMSRTFSS